MSQDILQEIEQNIRKAKKIVDIAEALKRLQMNRDFKVIIQDGYFQAEAVRLVHLKADQSFQSPDAQRSIIQQIDAVGALHQYFQTVFHKAAIAGKSIVADEEAREEVLAEEKDND